MASLGLDKEILPVLFVALITWGGVFFYLLRLELMAARLEALVSDTPEKREPGA